jgi:hypothetical protein
VRAPPPDFRYVGLAIEDRDARARLTVPAATAVVVVAGAALHGGVIEAVTLGAATLAGLDLARRVARRGRTRGSLAIVPWGILLSDGADLRVLPWPAVRRVHVQAHHRRDEGTAIVTDSAVVIETAREVFRAVAPGSVGLESLCVSVERWADEASCPIAIDLEGTRSLDVEPAEPQLAQLVAVADQLARRIRGPLGHAPIGYRGASDADAWRTAWGRLRSVLRSRELPSADPRPLAALVAARLGAIGCVPDLLRLVSAPSGFVALVAKAAALRLGAPLERAGDLEEVGAFVPPEDLADAALFAADAL